MRSSKSKRVEWYADEENPAEEFWDVLQRLVDGESIIVRAGTKVDRFLEAINEIAGEVWPHAEHAPTPLVRAER